MRPLTKKKMLVTVTYFFHGSVILPCIINRESYTSVHVLLNLLNSLGKKIRCESVFPNKFNKFNNTGARMQDSYLS